MTELLVAPCDHDAARYAVMHWHYSRAMPSGKIIKIGAWEDGEFIGVVLFGRGATQHLGDPYGLHQGEICELVRVAMREHVTPTSQLVAEALAHMHRISPGTRLVVSFADTKEGHLGTLYKAGNWIYTGWTDQLYFRIHGEIIHPKSVHSKWGPGSQSLPWLRENIDPNAERVTMPPKHRYLMPMDRAMRRQVEKLRLPYPTELPADATCSS